MMLISTLLSVVLVCGLSTAAPSPRAAAPNSKRGSGFELHQSKSRAVEDPVVRLANVYARFPRAAPDHVQAAVAAATLDKRVSGAVNLTFDAEGEYLTPIQIGTQTFHVCFDAAGADLWVFYTIGNGQRYVPSSSAKKIPGSWSLTYDSGLSAAGVLFADTVQVGAATATSQGIQAATSASSGLTSDKLREGVFGFSYSSENTASPQQKNIFDNLLGSLDLPVFTADLKVATPGVFGFGQIDRSRYNGSIVYASANTKTGTWTIALTGIGFGSTFQSTTQQVFMDTLDPYILYQTAFVNQYYAKVAGAQNSANYGGWVVPCSATLPSFSLGIGGTYFTVPGSYMKLMQVDSTHCMGALQPSSSSNYNIIGFSFLRGVFVVFDRGTNYNPAQPRVGVAAKTLS